MSPMPPGAHHDAAAEDSGCRARRPAAISIGWLAAMTWSSTSARTSTSCFTQSAARRRGRRGASGSRGNVRFGGGAFGLVERLDPVIRGEGVERRRAPVEGAAGRLDLEHGGLPGREVDAAVVGAPHGHDGVPGPALAEEVPVLPVERGHGGPRTGTRQHHGDEHDAQADRCPGNEPAPIAQAADHDRPERGEQRRALPSRSCSGPAGSWRASRSRRRRPLRRGTACCRR